MNPAPPKIWVASRVAVTASSVAYSLAIAAACLKGRPRSFSQAALYVRARAFSTPTATSAHLKATAWETTDGAAEGLALSRIGDRLVEAGLGQADGQSGDGDATVVEDGQEVPEALATLAEEVLGRDAAAVEDEAVGVRGVPSHFAVRRLDDEPGGAG